MSLQTRPSNEATPRPGISAPVRKTSAAPVFKPEFLRSVRMHPLIAAVVAAVVFAVIAGYAWRQQPVYEAEALVYVEPAASKVLDDGNGGQFDSNKYDSYLQQAIQTAQRLDILKATVHSLPLGVWRERDESEQQAAQRLQQSLKAERVLNSYQLSFTLKGPTAQGTAATLNAVIVSFLAAGRQNELSIAGEREQILTEEKNRISAELATTRAEQAALSSSLGMANPGLDADNPYDAQLVGLRAQLGEARQAHDVAAAQLASVSGPELARTQGLTAAADDLIAADAGLSSMKATMSQRRAILSSQMAGLTAENPIYKQDQTEIVELDRTLENMTTQMRDKAERRLQDKLRTDLARTGDVEARLNAQLAGQTYAATSAAPKLQRAAELTADIQRLMKRYATVDDSLRSVQLETSGAGMAHLALAAAIPANPVPSRRKLLMLAALPIGLLCGAFAAVFFRKRDPHVYTGRDLEELLGFTPMAVLPASEDVADGVMQEYVLRLAGGIENAFRTAGARSFVLTPTGTSVAPETLTLPLALKLRQLGLGVSTTTARHLMELEQGETLSDACLPEGDGHPGSIVEARLAALKQMSDLIFIDSPALLTSAETEYLVRCADATILIATSGVTRRGELMRATLLLERLGVKGVGAVLEGLHLRDADAAYRVAVAELDRRQSFEARAAARTLQAREREAPGIAEEHSAEPVLAAAVSEAFTPVEAESLVPGMAEDETESALAPLALGETTDAPAHESAAAAAEEFKVPEASARAAEEPLPMAVESAYFDQPDQPMLTEEQSMLEGAAAVSSVEAVHSVQAEQEAPEIEPDAEVPFAWLQHPMKAEEATMPNQTEHETAMAVAEVPVPAEMAAVEMAAVAEPVPVALASLSAQAPVIAVVAKSFDTNLAAPAGFEAALVPAVEPVFVPSVEAPAPVRRDSLESVARLKPIAPSQQAAPFQPPAPFQPVARRDAVSQFQAMARHEAAAQREQVEPIRTGRWEPARQASRAETTPWRDRRVSGPNTIYKAPERRFNWNTEAAKPLSLVAKPAVEPVHASPRTPEHATPPVVPEGPARLTRKWGLLSRFENGQAGGEDMGGQERNVDQAADNRGYRRG